jgi:hypothetical protein
MPQMSQYHSLDEKIIDGPQRLRPAQLWSSVPSWQQIHYTSIVATMLIMTLPTLCHLSYCTKTLMENPMSALNPRCVIKCLCCTHL